MKTEISSVGRLRAALAELPADQPIVVQVVAKDGKCWNVFADFYPATEQCRLGVISCHHPKLETLP